MNYHRKDAPFFAVGRDGVLVWSYGLRWRQTPFGLECEDAEQWDKAVAWAMSASGETLVKPHGCYTWRPAEATDPRWEELDAPEDLGIVGACTSKTLPSAPAPTARSNTSSTRSRKSPTRSVRQSLRKSGR